MKGGGTFKLTFEKNIFANGRPKRQSRCGGVCHTLTVKKVKMERATDVYPILARKCFKMNFFQILSPFFFFFVWTFIYLLPLFTFFVLFSVHRSSVLSVNEIKGDSGKMWKKKAINRNKIEHPPSITTLHRSRDFTILSFIWNFFDFLICFSVHSAVPDKYSIFFLIYFWWKNEKWKS